MDNRYMGELGTDVYDVSLNEFRIGHLRHEKPAVSDDKYFVDAETASTSEDVVVTEFENTKIDFPRNVIVKASDESTKKVTVYGKDYGNQDVTDVITLNGTTAVNGAVAFKEITKVVLEKGTAVAVSVGTGDKFGLPVKLANKTLVFALKDGVLDTTPVITVDTDVLGKNLIAYNGTLTANKTYDLFIAL